MRCSSVRLAHLLVVVAAAFAGVAAGGSLEINDATLPLEITYPPQSVSAVQGTSAPFSVGVIGTEPISYQWQVSTDNGVSWSDAPGFTLRTVSFPVSLSDDGNQYRVIVADSTGTTSITSEAATLTVTESSVFFSINEQPQNASAVAGGDASFTFDVSGSPTATFQWQYSSNGGGTWNNLAEGALGSVGTTIATLTLRSVTVDLNTYRFRCLARFGFSGNFSDAALLEVTVPDEHVYLFGKNRLFRQSSPAAPAMLPAVEGPWHPVADVYGYDKADFSSVTITPPGGEPAPFAWFPEERRWGLADDTPYDSQAGLDFAAPDSATPYVLAFNQTGVGIVTSSLVLNGGNYPPAPHLQNFASLTGINPIEAFEVSWSEYPGATAQDFVMVFIEDGSRNQLFRSLLPGAPEALTSVDTSITIPANTLLDAGTTFTLQVVFVKVSDSSSTDLSGATGYAFYATTTVAPLRITTAPIFVTHPLSETVNQGGFVQFMATLLGTSSGVTFQWRKDGVPIPGQFLQTLTLLDIQPSDAGDYDLVATNSSGSTTTDAATLTVIPSGPPAPPANPSRMNTTDAGFTATWDAVINATGYRVDVATDADFTSFVPGYQDVDVGNATTLDVTGLTIGAYHLRVRAYNNDGTGTSSSAVLIGLGGRVTNLSTRGLTGDGADTLIIGFVIQGTQDKTLLIRAAGPTLAQDPFNVGGTVADPRLALFDQDGGLIPPGNDDWNENDPSLVQAIADVSAFDFGSGSKDAALLVTLPPGVYTAHAQTVTGEAGVTIVELYELDGTSELVNVSARAFVGSGDAVLIPGAVLGTAPKRVLMRAVGRTLGQPPYNVPGVLDDPVIAVVPLGGSTPLYSNDDWGSDGDEALIEAAQEQVSAFSLPVGSPDAVLLADLPTGGFTFVVSGKAGATGIVLVELYVVP